MKKLAFPWDNTDNPEDKLTITEQSFLNYGVPSNWIDKYLSLGLTITSFKATSKKNLILRYGIPKDEVDFVKDCLRREPIEPDLLQTLLERNNFTCCLCKGTKSKAYIIHHIIEYSKTQDNSYQNLAVLCPNDHDEAHKVGKTLTNKITPENIYKAKANWEKQVENENVRSASINGDLTEIDYINYPRILELHSSIFDGTPKTSYSERLEHLGALRADGYLNLEYIEKVNSNPDIPFKFFAGFGSVDLRSHYFELFTQVLKRLDFVDLESLLSKRSIKNGGTIGRYCYYVGGLYGKRPDSPKIGKDGITHLFLRRKPFFVEWKVDPKYLVSSTARSRLSQRSIYLIYGVIRSTNIISLKGDSFVKIDIRPYAFGSPNVTKDRTPLIHYIKNQDYYDQFFEGEED